MTYLNKKNIVFSLLLMGLFITPFFSGGFNSVIEIINFIFIGLAFLFFSGMPEKEKVKTGKNLHIIYIFLFLLMSIVLISNIFSIDIYNSFLSWLKYLSYICVFIIFSKIKFSKKELDFFIYSWCGLSAILSLIGLYIYVVGNYYRLTSVFFWPNPFASFLLFSLFLSFYLILEQKRKTIPIIITVIIFSAFFLTGSRGAFLSFILGLCFYFIFLFKKIKKNWNYFAFAILFSALLINLILFLGNNSFSPVFRMKTSESKMDRSSNMRLDYWRGALDIAKDYPILGSGLASYGDVYASYQKNPISYSKYAHNIYLEKLAELGWIFSIFFFIFLIFNIKNGLSVAIKNKSYFLAIYSACFAFLVHNFFDIGWPFSANALIFSALVGIFYNNQEPYKKQKNYNNFFVVISLILIFSGIIILFGIYNFTQAKAWEAEGDLEQASVDLKKSIFLNPNAVYFRRLGIIYYSLGQYEEALIYLDKATKYNKTNPLNNELAGKIKEAQGDFELAEEYYKQAIKLDKYTIRFHRNLILLLVRQEKYQQAEEEIKKLLSYYTANVIDNRRINIMDNQELFSGVEKEIEELYNILREISQK